MAEATTGIRSFAKAMFAGRIQEELVFPYPRLEAPERERLSGLLADFRGFARRAIDPEKIDQEEKIPDEVRAGLARLGFYGLYVPEELGGLGLSQTAYCRLMEEVARVSPSLGVHLGAHQSIGYKGIALFGTPEQQRTFLPPLARGEKIACFALTEPEAGSDVDSIRSRAVLSPDQTHWVLDGEKIWIGNAAVADVMTVFAKTPVEVDGKTKERVSAFIVTRDLPGVEVGPLYKKLGIRGATLAGLRFRGCRVPRENVLGAPGLGFRQAMEILNNGRLSLAAGCVGGAKELLRLSAEHVTGRVQFGRPLAELGMVKEKLGWMLLHAWALESMVYLTTGLVDAGVEDYSLESAMCKVAATEFYWYAVNRAFQLRGGGAYIVPNPFERALRDARINTIFEGSNDVLRAYIALSGMKPVADSLSLVGEALREPIKQVGLLTDYFLDRLYRTFVSEKLEEAHPALREAAGQVEQGVRELAATVERLLKRHGREIQAKQFTQRRLAQAVMDLYAMVAAISRASSAIEERGEIAARQDTLLARLFCGRAHRRVQGQLRSMDDNDDEELKSFADACCAAKGPVVDLFGL